MTAGERAILDASYTLTALLMRDSKLGAFELAHRIGELVTDLARAEAIPLSTRTIEVCGFRSEQEWPRDAIAEDASRHLFELLAAVHDRRMEDARWSAVMLSELVDRITWVERRPRAE